MNEIIRWPILPHCTFNHIVVVLLHLIQLEHIPLFDALPVANSLLEYCHHGLTGRFCYCQRVRAPTSSAPRQLTPGLGLATPFICSLARSVGLRRRSTLTLCVMISAPNNGHRRNHHFTETEPPGQSHAIKLSSVYIVHMKCSWLI